MVVVTEEGIVLKRTQFSTDDSEMAEWTFGVKEDLNVFRTDFGDPKGIGVASPGIVGEDHRAVIWMQGRMSSVCGFDWNEYLKTPFFVPVLNDAKAALLGEAWLGAAAGVQNAVLLTLGTGVGGAAMVDGRLLHGAIGRAGHLGHISLDPSGPTDIVGTPGSLEDLVGGATLTMRSSGEYEDTQDLIFAAKQGNEDAAELWQLSIQALAAGIVSLINVLDPEVVILGGGITRAGRDLFDPLAKSMSPIEWRPFGAGVRVVPAHLGEFAGAIGAARFAMTLSQEIH